MVKSVRPKLMVGFGSVMVAIAGHVPATLGLAVCPGPGASVPQETGLDGSADQVPASAGILQDLAGFATSLMDTRIDGAGVRSSVCPCEVDLNGDGSVDLSDLGILATCMYTPPVGECEVADINCDGVIDDTDWYAMQCRMQGLPPDFCCPPGCCWADRSCSVVPEQQCVNDGGTVVPGACGLDTDADGFVDQCELCPHEPALAEPSEPGVELSCVDGIDNDCDCLTDMADGDCPYCTCGDIDGSGDHVDLSDFGLFALCYGRAEPTGDCTPTVLTCSDLDGSSLVDLQDFGLFALWYGQTSTQYPPNCAPE